LAGPRIPTRVGPYGHRIEPNGRVVELAELYQRREFGSRKRYNLRGCLLYEIVDYGVDERLASVIGFDPYCRPDPLDLGLVASMRVGEPSGAVSSSMTRNLQHQF
jgi:hypothetical protein